MSSAEPFLPVPDPAGAPEADVLPDDDRAELEQPDEAAEDRTAAGEDLARPARFDTPRPGDRLDADALRRDLEGD